MLHNRTLEHTFVTFACRVEKKTQSFISDNTEILFRSTDSLSICRLVRALARAIDKLVSVQPSLVLSPISTFREKSNIPYFSESRPYEYFE